MTLAGAAKCASHFGVVNSQECTKHTLFLHHTKDDILDVIVWNDEIRKKGSTLKIKWEYVILGNGMRYEELQKKAVDPLCADSGIMDGKWWLCSSSAGKDKVTG
ncbi:MAG: hypothetical protein K2K70_01725 [Lachnospiraceae bacterium]|nr:hypothetical protein [Lachnospiraceae bacterium]